MREMTLNEAWIDGHKSGTADEKKESKKLLEAAQRFVDKMNLIEEDECYKGVFQMAQVHGYNYNGPQYGEELKELKQVLDKYKETPNAT